MTVIFAEKPDMGIKIAAALDSIHLDNGIDVGFDDIANYTDIIKKQRKKDGYFRINFYDDETIVTWGYGHMVGLKQAKDYNEAYARWENLPLPYIPEEYELKVTTDDTRQFSIIERLFRDSDRIICATDDDREGDLIFDYIYTYIGCNTPFQRAVFNKQSKEEFIKSFTESNLIDSSERQLIIEAGRGRSIGDFICGAGPSVAMTLKYNSQDVLSVGRVQTAVLNMIVVRELDIINFKPQPYWVIKAFFKTPSGEVYEAYHNKKRFTTKEDADKVLECIKNSKDGFIKDIDIKQFKKKKPNLYSLATLQMDANKAFGFSLKNTSDIAQGLYDKGFITYPRTDSLFLPEDMMNEMDNVLSMLENSSYGNLFPQNKEYFKNNLYFDNSKVSSHYAIVPTSTEANGLNDSEEKIYSLIAKSVITMVHPEATLSKTTVTTIMNNEEFITNGNSVVDPGYMVVTGIPKEHLLPNLAYDMNVAVVDCKKEYKQTEPPKRYTEASLLNAMINCGNTLEDDELREIMSKGPDGKPRGLGRPSTQASIVATLERRCYIEKKGKTIHPTKKGMAMIQAFPVEDLKSAKMTAMWEKRLDDIEAGKETFDNFIYDLEESVRRWTKEIMESNKNIRLERTSDGSTEANYRCPVCKRKIKKLHWGYVCTGKDAEENPCSFSIGFNIAQKRLTDSDFSNLFNKGATGLIKGFVSSTTGDKFDAFLKYNPETKNVEFARSMDTVHRCFICKKPLKKFEWGYGCSGYSEGCKFALGSFAKRKLTESQVTNLLKGETVVLKDVTSKNGYKYDATIRICKEQGDNYGKLELVIDK